MKTAFLAFVASAYWATSQTSAAETQPLKTHSRVLESKAKEAAEASYYAPPHPGPVYYAPVAVVPPPPPPKLVQAKVYAGKANFIISAKVDSNQNLVSLVEGISSEVKAAASLIAEAKTKLDYGHKDYACDLVELSNSLIGAATAQAVSSISALPPALEKLKLAIAKVEAHIKWIASQYGYGYTPISSYVKNALDELKAAAEAVEVAQAAAAESRVLGPELGAALETAGDTIEKALEYCGDDSGYDTSYGSSSYLKKNAHDMIAYLKKALVAADEAVKAADGIIDALLESFNKFVETYVAAAEAVGVAFDAISKTIKSKQQGYAAPTKKGYAVKPDPGY